MVNTSTTSCKPYFKKLKNMTIPCVCVCVYVYIYIYIYIYEIFLYTKMYLSRFKQTLCFIHMIQGIRFTSGHNTKLFEESTT